MNRNAHWMVSIVVALALAGSSAQAQAQGRGNDKDKGKSSHSDKSDKADKAHGKSQSDHDQKGRDKKDDDWKDKDDHKDKDGDRSWSSSSGSRGNLKRYFVVRDMSPIIRTFAVSRNDRDRMAAGAIARANARGANDDAFVITSSGQLLRISNRSGNLLVDLDDDRARRLGAWDVRPVNDRVNSSGPPFCRSGAGHPVWGRQWCLDKGFGLGTADNVRWGRTNTLDNVVFLRPVSTASLTRDSLLGLLGDIAFNRLALHAVTLGYSEPLTGVWVTDNSGPNVLRLNSGSYPVAELVDGNRDHRADVLVVALRPW